MCLYTNKLNPEVATSNIPVWKVLSGDDFAPYYPAFKYCHGKNVATFGKSVRIYNFMPKEQSFTRVEGGYLHAFKEKQTADLLADALRRVWHAPYKVVAMYVPRGAEYWAGQNEIAARALCWEDETDDVNV